MTIQQWLVILLSAGTIALMGYTAYTTPNPVFSVGVILLLGQLVILIAVYENGKQKR